MEKTGKQSNSILRQDLSEAYRLFSEGNNGKKVINVFRNKKYRIRDTNLTYRTINHWEQIKLINSKRENDSEWRKFNFLDLVWLRIISKLRDLNLPLETIKAIKRSITLDLSGLYYQDFLLYLSIELEIPLCLIAFPDGSAVIATHKELTKSIEGGFIESQFIYIDISEILNQIPRTPYLSILEKPMLVTKEETKIFNMIRKIQETGNAKIHLEIKDKRPVKLEIETLFQRPTKENDNKEFMDEMEKFLKKDDYSDVLIRKEAGQIVCYSVREKIKLQEKPGQLER